MTTSNTDLANISRHLNMPQPIICFDEQLLNTKKLATQYFVLNLGSLANGGTHWVALAIRGGKEAVYFDSFGAPFSRAVSQYISGFSKKGYNVTQIQDIHSDLCGWYCMLWLKHIQSSKLDMYAAANAFVNQFFSDYDGNDELLRMKYLDNYNLSTYLKAILLKV